MTEQESLGDLIYETLMEDEVTRNISGRAYVTDILSEAIIKAGYLSHEGVQSMLDTLAGGFDEMARIRGYIRLAEDQSLPYIPFRIASLGTESGYSEAQKDMLTPKDGTVWRRVHI